MVVDTAPVVANHGRNQQQQGGLWLMEVGYQSAYYFVVVSGGYDYARGGNEFVAAAAGKMLQYGVERLSECHLRVFGAVWIPLRDFALPFAAFNQAAYVVEAFEGAYGGGAYCVYGAACSCEGFDGGAVYGNELAVHGVLA